MKDVDAVPELTDDELERQEYERWKYEKIAEACREAENGGKFVSNEDMAKWVQSLGTDNELPMPEATITREDLYRDSERD